MPNSSTTLHRDAAVDVSPQEAHRILEEARRDFRRATAELDAARERLLTTYRDVHPIIDRATASSNHLRGSRR